MQHPNASEEMLKTGTKPGLPEKRKVPPVFARRLMDYEDALHQCLDAVSRPMPAETVSLTESIGRILREDVGSRMAVPPFAKSTMDGYAVKAVDVHGATETKPVGLTVVDYVHAGGISEKTLKTGEAIKIMTGAAVPEGADAVIKIEQTVPRDGHTIEVLDGVGENNYIISKGQDILPGNVVATAGETMDPMVMGVVASCGVPEVPVSAKPEVGIISTGSELVPPGHPLGAGQIYDINGYMLFGLTSGAGCNVELIGAVQDKSDALLALLSANMNKNILLLSGGVSVGDYDIVHETLQRAGVEEIFWRVRVKPGKPLFFGRKGNTLIFGLPGNPVSAATNFFVFVRPVIDKLLGKKAWGLETGYCQLGNSRIIRPGRRKFLKGKIVHDHMAPCVWIIQEQRSGVFSPMTGADVLIEVQEDVNSLKKGERVKVHYLP
ncbi:MAG: molybdopterin molybdotransferase MoeA [Thermodesulfobacteriota bacterium]|nr:molybdopterin molybdotransferase MoeA [Thermodesulfobacteriota bacterium]